VPAKPGRRAVLALLAASVGPAGATTSTPPEVLAELPAARLQGRARLTWFSLPIYDARLWVGVGFRAQAFERTELALELEYARSLRGEAIAERSLEEMRRGGNIGSETAATWLAHMRAMFPDVVRGDRLTAVHRPGRALRLYFNAQLRGEVADAEFGPRFLAIWLGHATSQPQLRLALIGEPGGPAS
jgi:Chalcone isomerase-like